MKKVAEAVLQLIQQDDIALESFREEILNLSAYANKIHDNVEKLTYKDVKKGTIVVALSRLSKTDLKNSQKAKLQISHLSSRSPVISFTYQKTQDTERRVSTLNPYLVSSTDLFGIIEGESEIIIIASEKAADLIRDHINVIPKKEIADLVAITVQFSNQNGSAEVLHTLLSLLAVNKIAVVNILPSTNEISFIMDRVSTESAIALFNLYANKEK
jgi:hypothetical protein